MAADLLYLTRDDVRALIPDWHTQIDIVEQTYVDMSAGTVEMPPKPGIHPRPDAFIHAMPAYLERSDVAALKWVSGYPTNKALGIPYINGLLILNEAATGIPIAVMDCVEITAARTAVVALLAAAEMLRALNPDAEIVAYDPNPERADALRGRTATARSVVEAITDAEVVISAAPIVKQPQPTIFPGMLAERHLVLPIDFDAVVCSVGGGGRYDDLVARFTGQSTPATGFSFGVSRLASALRAAGRGAEDAVRGPVVVIVFSEEDMAHYLTAVAELRGAGIAAELYLGRAGMKAQMKYADRRGSPAVVILGGDEIAAGEVTIKDLDAGRAAAAAIADNDAWKAQRPGQMRVARTALVGALRAIIE